MGWKAAQKLIQNWKILRGDNVMTIRCKDKGETGLIKRVVRSQNRVIVEGKNLLFWDLIPTWHYSGSQNGAFYPFDFVPAHGSSD